MFDRIRVDLKGMTNNGDIKLHGISCFGKVSVFSGGGVLRIQINNKDLLMLPTVVPILEVSEILDLTKNMFDWNY
ncbi:MAG: hypothetical protein ACFFG0_04115 [Candidatus Thorarchaeota archaeon]